MEWPGLKLSLDKTNNKFVLHLCDHRETGITTPINSAKSSWNFNNFTNLFDGAFHTLMTAWAMNDNSSIQFTAGYDSEETVSRGILVLDNLLLTPISEWNNKRTPFNFSYNDSKKSTFLAIGGEYADGNSATGLTYVNNTQKHFNGIIKEIVIWDRVLTASIYSEDYYPMNGPWEHFYNGEDPLTGANLKSFSANVVTYYKFAQELDGSITAKDYAGSTNGGAQTNPSVGNTLNLFGSIFDSSNYYTITDTSLITQNHIHSSGELLFTTENGNKIKIGKVFYELGIIVFDNEYNNSSSGLPLLSNLSNTGMTLNDGLSTNNLYINSINFTSSEIKERMTLNLNATGDMMNLTENKTGIDQTTGKQILNENAGYITSVGLYNDRNELLAVAKLNKPVRKDIDHNVDINVQLDF